MTNWPAFRCEISGKWVLAGEHAVLRGATAVALPHPSAKLSLDFQPGSSESDLMIDPASARGILKDLLQVALEKAPGKIVLPPGTLTVESTIPLGSGLGSSAALCVAFTRWLSDKLGLKESDHFEFAKQLENRFHGKSSGMDVAATCAGEPISFSMEKGANPIGVRKIPRFTFHDTGDRARTSDCIKAVEKFRSENTGEAARIDRQMVSAGREAIEGLIRFDRGKTEDGLQLVASAMKEAQGCFDRWGLMPESGLRLQAELLEQGALATKLTGAGGGGFIVALWGDV